MYKNVVGQRVFFELLDTITGAPVTTGAVTVYVTKDGGAQAVAGGSVDNLGNGQYRFNPSADDTNGTILGFLFTHASGIYVSQSYEAKLGAATPETPTSGTVGDLIAGSLKLIGVLAAGEALDAAEGADALARFNDLLDSWKNEELTIYTQSHTTYSLSAGVQTYTIGSGATFSQERPLWIDRVTIVSLNNPTQPLELAIDMLTDDQWAAIPVKSVTSSLPRKVHFHSKFPFAELDYWPIPSTSSVQTTIYTPGVVATTPIAWDTVLSFPPGYARALRSGLGVELCPEFGRSLDPVVAMIAAESKAAIKRVNRELTELRCDPALVSTAKGRFNWLIGS
jgi:hypothetical protein